METNKKTFLNRLISLLGILLLGAIGSGVWDIFLKDLFFNIGGLFVNIMAYLYSGYIDSLYEDVGKMKSFLVFIPALLFIIIVIFSPFLVPLIVKFRLYSYEEFQSASADNVRKNRTTKVFDFLSKSKKRFILFLLIIFIPMSLLYTDLLIKEMSAIRARNYLERTTEIIRPYVSEHDYFKLRSEFRQIDEKRSL